MNEARQAAWARWLSDQRLGSASADVSRTRYEGRSEFERDYDRIIYSSAFRRMQDKTQVFPLSPTDYTRTRLTHSLEVSTVGRSLGQMAGRFLRAEGLLPAEVSRADLGTLVAAACIAHDLGNPPFGHAGEAAIQSWARHWLTKRRPALSEAECLDLLEFEGNAQGFRIVSRLQARERPGGLQNTLAFIGTMAKYPAASLPQGRPRDVNVTAEKKFGYFQEDKDLAESAFSTLGLRQVSAGIYRRHPLAYLMEAADDVCYGVIDIEDAFKLRLIDFETCRGLLTPLAAATPGFRDHTSDSHSSRVSRLRAAAIHALTVACFEAFKAHLHALEAGTFEGSLIDRAPMVGAYRELIDGARRHAYNSEHVVQIACAGFRVLGGLLELFADALTAPTLSMHDRMLLHLLPLEAFSRPGRDFGSLEAAREALTPAEKLLTLTDYISGMTDRYALQQYQYLFGIRTP